MNLLGILEDKQKGEGALISWLLENDITLECKIRSLRKLLQRETSLSERGSGNEKAEFSVGHCGPRIWGDSELSGLAEPVGWLSSGAAQVMVREPRRGHTKIYIGSIGNWLWWQCEMTVSPPIFFKTLFWLLILALFFLWWLWTTLDSTRVILLELCLIFWTLFIHSTIAFWRNEKKGELMP